MRHRVTALSVVCLLTLAPLHAADDPATAVIQRLDARSDAYAKVALPIWHWAELGFQETKSSALLQQQLAAAGFRLQAGVADMPTAFIAEWGSGTPVIGIFGEFDALPGLSQQAVPERSPVVEAGPGHACGHHTFGVASAAAAIAVKEWLEQTKAPGTMGDVSWVVPTVQMSAAIFVPGIPAHSWQATASGATTSAMKGMMVAAKTMTLTALDLFTDPSLIAKAKLEFAQKTGPGSTWRTRVGTRRPPYDFRT